MDSRIRKIRGEEVDSGKDPMVKTLEAEVADLKTRLAQMKVSQQQACDRRPPLTPGDSEINSK